MEGKYHILGITTEGKRNYWTGSGWSEVLTDSKIFTDLDDARDEWWEVTGNGKKLPEGFKRIIVPNYPEPAPEPKLVQMPGTQGNWGEKHWGKGSAKENFSGDYSLIKSDKDPKTASDGEVVMSGTWAECIDAISDIYSNYQEEADYQKKNAERGGYTPPVNIEKFDEGILIVSFPRGEKEYYRILKTEKESAKESTSGSSPKSVSSIEQDKILNAIRKEKRLWDNFPDILSSYSKGLDFVVEMDNSNATYISSLEDSLWKVCDELGIGFDSESNGEGFYGRNYIFYHYDDDNDNDNSATEIAVRNPDGSAGFDMKSLVEDFQKYLSNQRRYDNVWYSGKPDSFTVDVDGDWKHDHLYMDMLVEEFLNDRGLTLADVQARTTEEDGSDWYRAERTYRIKVPKTGELTAGQIAKKINDKFNDSLSSNAGGNYNVKNVQIYNPDYKKAEESIKGQASSNFSRKSVYESIIGRR